MKHQILSGVMLAASFIIACNQKKPATSFESGPVPTPLAIVPESPDTLLSNGRRNIFLVGRRELPGLLLKDQFFLLATGQIHTPTPSV